MIAVDTVYKTLQTLLNKEIQGHVTPTEFNLLAKTIQDEIYREYFEDHNRDDNKENRGVSNESYSNLAFNQRQRIDQFSAIQTLTLNGTQFNVPTDLYFIEHNGIVVNVTGSLPRVVEEIKRSSIGYANMTEVAPTTTYPVYERFGDFIRVFPVTIGSIDIRYIRTPKDPKWTYREIANIEMFDPSSPDFQNFELHESEFSNVVMRMLALFGINIREEQVIAVAGAANQVEQIKTNN